MNEHVNLHSLRARKARLARRIGKGGYDTARGVTGVCLVVGLSLLY